MSAPAGYSDPEVLARIVPLGLRARYAVRGLLSGLHKSPLAGSSVEFAEYREYAPGDDLKRIDWRVYARTGRYVVKRYEEETNLRATFVVDASRSMRYGSGALSKFAYAATAVASLATLAVEQRDAAGLLLCDESPTVRLRPSTTRAQLSELCTALERAEPARTTGLGEVLERAADELPPRGLVVVASDFLCDQEMLLRALGRLRSRGHEPLLLQVLDPDELDLPFTGQVEFRDIEGGARLRLEPQYFRESYRRAMDDFVRTLEVRSRELGCDVRLLRTDRPLTEALSAWLHHRRRGAAGRTAVGRRGGGG